MRDAFISYIYKRKEMGENVFLIVADLGYSVIEKFAKRFPESFLNVGVAEQNMAGIAAGIASEGFQVFTYSIGNFNTFRCAEQIRNDIDYHNFPVCTVTVGGGVAYGNMGYSHQAIQDYALMRSMPNTLICAPSDKIEVTLCLDQIFKLRGPSYLRLHKVGESVLNTSTESINPGDLRYIAGDKNSRFILITTGYAAHIALKAANLSTNRLCIYSLPVWGAKVSSQEAILKIAEQAYRLYIYEDHLTTGGFGSYILELLVATNHISKVRLKGLNSNVLDIMGSEDYILRSQGLFEYPIDDSIDKQLT